MKDTGQIEEGNRRQWFYTADMDLIVWSDESDSIVRFELYYDKIIREHVLVWGKDHGFSHLAVDDGEQKPVLDYKETPILIPDGRVDINRIHSQFEKSCKNFPADVVALVRDKLQRYPV